MGRNLPEGSVKTPRVCTAQLLDAYMTFNIVQIGVNTHAQAQVLVLHRC